jgi:N-acetyl-anhydromuramyl-L-alanine amidase AmpD
VAPNLEEADLPGPIEDLDTPNFRAGRDGRVPRAVVIHTTVGTFGGTCAWFSEERSAVSSHYLVGLNGRIARFVHEADTARHAGRVLRPSAAIIAGEEDPNLVTVGIEFEDGGDPEIERPAAQYAAGAWLLEAVCDRWDIPVDREHVIGHREIFAAKTCPGSVSIERLIEEAAAPRRRGREPRP